MIHAAINLVRADTLTELGVQDGMVRYDGNPCEDPEDRMESYLYGREEEETSRLTTFRTFPSTSTARLKSLASAGFYYTGHGDVVKCFSCGQCVENMTRNDDPRSNAFHRPDCEHTNGIDPRNVSANNLSLLPSFLPMFSRNNDAQPRNATASSRTSSMEVATSAQASNRPTRENPIELSPAPERNRSTATRNTQTREQGQPPVDPRPSQPQPPRAQEPHSRPSGSSPTLDNPIHPHMREIRVRQGTFGGWDRNQTIASPRDIAEAGFFYLGNRDRVKCWYCNGGLENWELEDDPWIEHAKWFPRCQFLQQQKGQEFINEIRANFPNQNMQQSNIRGPSGNRRGPSANRRRPADERSLEAGPREREAIARELEVAAQRTSRPGSPRIIRIGHPGMNISIRMRGSPTHLSSGGDDPPEVEIFRRGFNRPPVIQDRQLSAARHEETVNQALRSSPLVTAARDMGFQDNVIKIVLLSKCEQDDRIYENIEEFMEALIEYQSQLERAGQNANPQPAGAASSAEENPEHLTPAERELRQIEERRNCRLCRQNRANIVLMPCAHLAICENCSNRPINICPICQRLVNSQIRSFLS